MPLTILGFECSQGTKDSSLLEYIGVVEDLWKNMKAVSSSPRPHESSQHTHHKIFQNHHTHKRYHLWLDHLHKGL